MSTQRMKRLLQDDSQVQDVQEVITIGLYSKEKVVKKPIPYISPREYNFAVVESALKNAIEISARFSKAASQQGKKAPVVEVYAYLVPDWHEGSDFTHEAYLALAEQFIKDIAEFLQKHDGEHIVVKNFLELDSLTLVEKAYLRHLTSLGSVADMIKTRAVLDHVEHRHLQMDSNTKISSIARLYQLTFSAKRQEVAMNAASYPRHYIAAHNKIVYTPSSLEADVSFVEILQLEYLSWCDRHKDFDGQPEKTKRNSIYSKVFAVATYKAGYTDMMHYEATEARPFDVTIYAARLDLSVFRMTQSIVTAVNQSWKSASGELSCLSDIPSVEIGDTQCGVPAYSNIVKKYTESLHRHSDALRVSEEHIRASLIAIANTDVDVAIMVAVIKRAASISSTHLHELSCIVPEGARGWEFKVMFFGPKLERRFTHTGAESGVQIEEILESGVDSSEQSASSKPA